MEHKDVFGITFEQGRNELKFGDDTFSNIVTRNRALTDEQKRDLTLCLIALKYTQSNSVCYVKDGQAIGVGAGQQSRIHCTRLAGNKADIWYLRQHPKCCLYPSSRTSAVPTGIIPSTFIFPTITWMCWLTVSGSSFSP